MREFLCPEPIRVDAYQAGHFEMIPSGMENFQCSQGIFRKPLIKEDYRLISAGLNPFIRLNLENQELTQADVKKSEEFYNDFHADLSPPYSKPYPWPKQIFQRVVNEFGGILPIVITGMLDGQAHYVGEPHVQVWTDEPGMGELVGWIESTMLPYLWCSSIVATRGRIRKDKMMNVFKNCYPSKTKEEIHQMVAYKFHDFGRRGGASSQITGIAHLINWLGTDTNDAAYAATRYLNNGKKFGACSIVAAAHRTVTPWEKEVQAYQNMVQKFSNGIFAIVADSYNYIKGMEMLAGFAEIIKTNKGFLVGRPDSGDPVQSIIDGLKIFEKAFGFTKQEKGLKIINNAGIIQGDGVSDEVIFEKIYPTIIQEGFCPSNVAFGMGEHNHKCVRSETEEGYKTCLVGTRENSYRPVMKGSESKFKMSLPCPVSLHLNNSENRVKKISVDNLIAGNTEDMICLFNGRKRKILRNKKINTFDETRKRAYESWEKLDTIPKKDTFDPEIREMQKEYLNSK